MKSLNQEGFTFLELLVSIVILSVGLIAIYRPLLTSLSALHFIDSRVEANRLIGRELWEFQEHANLTGELLRTSGRGLLTGKEKVFHYNLEMVPLDKKQRIYQIDYQLSWSEVGRRKRLSRVNYVLLPYETSE